MSTPRVNVNISEGQPSRGKTAKRRRARQRRASRRRGSTPIASPQNVKRAAAAAQQGFSRMNRITRRELALEKNAIRSGSLDSISPGKQAEQFGLVGRAAAQVMTGPQISRMVAQKSLSGEYAHIQGAIVAPQLVPPERYSTEYASKPTALANPWTVEDYPWGSTVNPNAAPLGASEMLMAVFRDPVRNMVFYDQNSAAAVSDLSARITPQSGGSSVPLPVLTVAGTVSEFDEDIECPFWAATSTYQPHGPVLYAGSDDRSERTYRWFDMDEDLSVDVALGASVAWGITLSLDKFSEDAVIEDAYTSSASGTSNTANAVVNVTSPGYYSPHVFFELATAQTAAITLSSTTEAAVFCHRPLPGFATNQLAVDGIRIAGVSAMYTNNAAMIQKAGTITGYQVPKETDWQQFIGPLSLVSRLNDSRTIDIANGMYGFLKPTETEDFDLQEAFACDPVTGSITASYYSLRNVKSYLILRGTIVPSEGRSGFMTVANSVEYLTTDVWRPVDIARTEPNVYKKAMEELKSISQWHENPTHVQQIFKQVLSGATSLIKGVQKYAPTALSIAELLGTLLV